LPRSAHLVGEKIDPAAFGNAAGRDVPNLSDPQDVEIPHPLFERTIQGARQFLTKPSSTRARSDVFVNQDRFENRLMSTLSKSGKATK
jgi:hypothetical protein